VLKGEIHTTVIKWLKKAKNLPELSEILIELDPNDANAIILELDELWSNVSHITIPKFITIKL
jgi:hypothetical protein